MISVTAIGIMLVLALTIMPLGTGLVVVAATAGLIIVATHK
jgi:hypothetical protein